jgi:hypothetical protein
MACLGRAKQDNPDRRIKNNRLSTRLPRQSRTVVTMGGCLPDRAFLFTGSRLAQNVAASGTNNLQ